MVMTVSRRWRDGSNCLLVLSLMCCVAPAWGAGTGTDARSLSAQLQEEAKAATALSDLNQVLDKIVKLRATKPEVAIDAYLSELQAWVLHRRGEAYVQQAADAVAANQIELSKRLDTQAMQDFDAAIKLDPNRWKSYHHRGVCHALAADFDKAQADFSKAIELRPDYANAWFNRAEIHYEQGRYPEALSDYNEAIRLQDDDAGFYTGRAHTYVQSGKLEQALADYHRAVKLDPENSDRLTNRGDCYRSLGDWDRAASDFRQAIELDGQFGRAFQSAAWLMATCPVEEFRNPELAVRAAQKAIELDGDEDYIYLDTLAAAWANVGQFEKARDVMRRAIVLAPAENRTPLEKRLALFKSGKPFRQAVDAPARRVASRPKNR
jgi:tetratricopeptide (TPR) repeat protein